MIDLTKLTPRELPKKTVKVNILGSIQEQDIRPLSGEARLKYWALDFNSNAAESTKERVLIALTAGAGLEMSDAIRLIGLDWDAATNLAGQVHVFTNEFDDRIRTEKDAAEKNLNPESSTATQG